RNVSVGVERPTHNHIATGLITRNNVFIAETNMSLSFQRSSGCIFQGNTLFAPGVITLSPPNAVKLWTNNVVFHGGLGKAGAPQSFTIADALPPTPAPTRRTAPFSVARVAQPPTLDGEIGWSEWPNDTVSLDRDPSRWTASGAPAFAKLAHDDQHLYVAVNVAMFDVTRLRKGTTWGKDDGAEVCIAGKEGTFVIHGFADGTVQSVTDAGAPADAAARLGKAVRFAVKPYGKTQGGWRAEWAIPFAALDLKPAPGLKIAFNVGLFRAGDGVWRCVEGTLAQNWRLDQAATLQLK
ncbi:MAG: sugar-binding protein, partial [Limisphaerales bacterium]